MSAVKALIAGLALIAASSSLAVAQDTRRIDRVQAGQVQSIDQLRRSGQLTRREYATLMSEQARIAAMERDAQSDGRVTGREYRSIREAQNAAGNHIYSESHNNRVNYWRLWKWNNGLRY